MKSKKVLVGLSASWRRADSLLAMMLLKSQGYAVHGLYLKTPELVGTPPEELSDSYQIEKGPAGKKKEFIKPRFHTQCSGPKELERLEAFCKEKAIPLDILDVSEFFENEVVDQAIHSTLANRKPLPCLDYLDHVKIPALLARAKELGIEHIGLGLHAQILVDQNQNVDLMRSVNLSIDQSHELFRTHAQVLKKMLLPLGSLSLSLIERLAKELGITVNSGEGSAGGMVSDLTGLANPENSSSNECFQLDEAYFRYVEFKTAASLRSSGIIRTMDGGIVGNHHGLHRYLVGQTTELELMNKDRKEVFAVVGHDTFQSALIIGGPKDVEFNRLVLRDLIWVRPIDQLRLFQAHVQVGDRKNVHQGQAVLFENDRGAVEFLELKQGLVPGDSVTFYDHDSVIGGGFIDSVEKV